MTPSVDLASLKVMEAAVAARVAEKKKNRPVVEASQYDLRHLRKVRRTKPTGYKIAWTEEEAGPKTPLGSIPIGVPLVEVVWANPVVTVKQKAGASYLPEPARDKIRSTMILGDI